MNYELLTDVAKVIMGQSPPSSTYNTVGEGLPFYQGKTDFGDMYPTPRVYCTEPSRIAEAGDILISVRAPVGPTNISQERSCIGRGISAIRVGKKLDRDFLLYFLRFYEPALAQAGTGSTFAAIAREDLETIKIPLPPLDEQKRIASLLMRADRLRGLRRAARELGQSLLQSVFLEMFGKPEENPKGFDVFELGEIGTLNRGLSKNRPRNAPELYGGKYPLDFIGNKITSTVPKVFARNFGCFRQPSGRLLLMPIMSIYSNWRYCQCWQLHQNISTNLLRVGFETKQNVESGNSLYNNRRQYCQNSNFDF